MRSASAGSPQQVPSTNAMCSTPVSNENRDDGVVARENPIASCSRSRP
jgi:hypothetical protein